MKNKLELRIVHNEEDKMKAFIVRALVYMGEQNCPYDEEFDKNDYTATQIVGFIGTEPIITGRIRYFGGFAKLERLAIVKQYRGKGYGQKLLSFLICVCQQKGINKVCLYAQSGKEMFYKKNGFSVKGKKFQFSGYYYCEMEKNIGTDNSLINSKDPMILNRPEGSWLQPGPLEKESKVTYFPQQQSGA